MERNFRLMVAPLQGLTEAEWRSAHFVAFEAQQGAVEYFTPFVRVEKGQVRPRDLRDFTSELNRGVPLTPQIIFRDLDEWRQLVDTLVGCGARSIDMNMGCPFPPQVQRGRGAGLLVRRDVLEAVAEAMADYAGEVSFSVKMRLGINQTDEALQLAGVLNAMELRHVTVHPRTASQQYRGELHLAAADALAAALRHPVVFNGQVATPADIAALAGRFDGVMVGRGLLARPSLLAEYRSGREWSEADRHRAYLELVAETGRRLGERLCGDAQLRDKLKPYWEYAPPTLDRKLVKQGKKGFFNS